MINAVNKVNTGTNTQVKPRIAAAKSQGAGWKVFIMVASLVATVGGWGILAVDQGQSAAAQTQVARSSSVPVASAPTTSTNRQAPVLRQVNGQSTFPNVITRSRSSR